jgi:hypothetical protein
MRKAGRNQIEGGYIDVVTILNVQKKKHMHIRLHVRGSTGTTTKFDY